jgi:hypothetical protein
MWLLVVVVALLALPFCLGFWFLCLLLSNMWMHRSRISTDTLIRYCLLCIHQCKCILFIVGNRLPGAIDLMSAVGSTKSASSSKKKKGDSGSRKLLNQSRVPTNKDHSHVDVALAITQKSTASMGRFDAQRFNEPEKKKVSFKKKDVLVDVRAEKKKSMGIFDKMFGGAGSGMGDRFDVGKAANISQAKGDQDRARKRQKK